MPCNKYTEITASDELANRLNEITDGIEKGDIDFSTVTMRDWLDISFLMLYHGKEMHINENIMYGGNVYTLHSCIEQVVPNQQVSALRNMV